MSLLSIHLLMERFLNTIAKVEKGQGYYRRTAQVPALSGAQELLSLTQGRLEDRPQFVLQSRLALFVLVRAPDGYAKR